MRRQLGRRELIRRMGQLGVAAVAANTPAQPALDAALAADFDWKKHKGTQLKLLLNKHPYADAMIANLDTFKDADRHGRHLRRLPGGRLFRQGDGGAVVRLEPSTTPS